MPMKPPLHHKLRWITAALTLLLLASSCSKNDTIREVFGTAHNAKPRAIVEDASGAIYYLDDLMDWPSDFVGKEVRVYGVLIEDDRYTSNDGSVGTPGSSKIFVEAQYEIVAE